MVNPKFAMLQKTGSHPLQRAATGHSREPMSSDTPLQRAATERPRKRKRAATEHAQTHEGGIAAEQSATRGCELDPDIRLQKSETAGAVSIKTHNLWRPDVGIGIRVAVPCDRAGEGIEYYGEYLGHGKSETAFELKHSGARFHGKVLKVAKADDMEPLVFKERTQANLTTSVLYNCHGKDVRSGRQFHCWITDRTIPLDEFCRFDEAIKTRCSLAAFCCILKAARHGLYLSDCHFHNFGVQLTDNSTEHLVVIIDAGSRGINRGSQ